MFGVVSRVDLYCVPSPGVENIIDEPESVFLVGELERIADYFRAGVQLVHFLRNTGIVVTGRGGAGVDACRAVSSELVDDGFANRLCRSCHDADETILQQLVSHHTEA